MDEWEVECCKTWGCGGTVWKKGLCYDCWADEEACHVDDLIKQRKEERYFNDEDL